LLSNPAGRKSKARILKSNHVMGFEVSLDALEQVALGDLPPSRIEEDPSVAKLAEIERARKAAQATEARATALERRAAAFLKEAEETALDRLVEMEEQVDAALSRAAESVQSIEAEARDRGYAAGHEEGLLQGLEAGRLEGETLLSRAKTEADHLNAQAKAAAEALNQKAILERAELLDASKAQVLELTFAMVRQVLRAEAILNPLSMLPMLEAALAKLKGDLVLSVRLSPAVLATLEEHRGRLMTAAPGTRQLVLEGDVSMLPGDFVVQGTQGVVDGRIDQQIQAIQEAVHKER